MLSPSHLVLLSLLLASVARGADEWLDRLDEALNVAAFQGNVRAHLSGTVELEAYHTSLPAPGLIDSTQTDLFNPRLTLFLDAQFGSQLYLFAQARVDRGFDPSDHGARGRMDEYALRYTPWEDGRLNLQFGKFATVVGRWNERHLAWDNPFINAPLPYENVTAVSDLEPPESARSFVATHITAKDKYEHNPILWGPVYTSGFSVAGRVGKFDFAAELKNASLSSRPSSWDLAETGFTYPTLSGRAGYRPTENWTFGVSASRGAYQSNEADALLPKGRDRGDYREALLGQDVSFEWHHWQVWAEIYEARFEMPNAGHADLLAYYLEAKYKFTPQLFGALRWNQEFTSDSDNVWRVDFALGFRFTAHTQLKLQYDLSRHDEDRPGYGHLLAAQLMARF